MGMQLEQTPEMGEYIVEVRRESFYIQGISGQRENKHTIFVYPDVDGHGDGVAEILIADIPKIRAALDEVERYANNR
jgi:hypothetical protein